MTQPASGNASGLATAAAADGVGPGRVQTPIDQGPEKRAEQIW
jgi:hypothetical protein